MNGDAGNGVSRKITGSLNHFSFTRMKVAGRLASGAETGNFTGIAWMDREYGTWEEVYWDWFSIQFDDETELMIYEYRDETADAIGDSTGTFVDKDGACQYLAAADYEITSTATWTSEKTSAEYPSEWRITVPNLEIDLEIKACFGDQELDTRGTPMIVYCEGVCKVSGTRVGNPVNRRAYAELVGYDR